MSDELLAAAEEARQYLADLVIHRQIDRDEAMPLIERLTRATAKTYLAKRSDQWGGGPRPT